MLTIYGTPTFNTIKILLTAEQLGLEYDYVHVDLAKGESRTPEFLARNPMGKVPVIEHDGRTLSESNAICRYLAETAGGSLYQGDACDRARINQWIDMMALHAGRWLSSFYFEEYIRGVLFKQEPSREKLEEARGFLEQQLPVIEQQLESNTWLAGSTLSLADLIAFSYFNTHEYCSVSLDAYPGISRWYRKLSESEAFKRVQSRLSA